MRQTKGVAVYLIILLVSLFVIFFVGKKVDTSTGQTSTIITADGLHHFKKGMDIAGGVRLHYKIDLSKYRELYPNAQEYAQVTRNVQDIILQNIDTRISKLGVSDYSSYIQTLDDEQFVIVELGGVHDLQQAKNTIGKTVELEFKTAYQGNGSDVQDSRQLLAEGLLKQAVESPDMMATIAASKISDDVYYQLYQDETLDRLPEIYQNNLQLLEGREGGSVYPTVIQGVYAGIPAVDGVSPAETLEGWLISRFIESSSLPVEVGTGDAGSGATTTYTVEEIFVASVPSWVTAKDPKTNEILNGAFFNYANVSQSQTGQPVVVINFNEKGKEIFCNITEQIVGQQLAIFVGGKMVTAPVIQEKICGGSAQIDGQFDSAGAKVMVTELNDGALPAPLILAHEEKVSASLGEKALVGAMIAGGVGLAVVFIYMVLIYGFRRGVVALITLISFLVVLFAIIKLIGFALSLSGIAAILLSLGMGVDANILVYERVNEELDDGKPIDSAIEDGYERSLSAIRDGNVTTGMIALLLFFIGTNVFKGFGTMMLVNIIITLSILVPFMKYCLHWFEQKK